MPGAKKDKKTEPKRLNRTARAGELIGPVLGPALQKRGFANRDLIAQWHQIAPEAFREITQPDRIAWPRTEAGTEGARLFLRCTPGRAHEVAYGERAIVAAINRYFGYFLVGSIKLSANPFSAGSGTPAHKKPQPDATQKAKVDTMLTTIEDEPLKEALRDLGHAILTKDR